MTRAREVLGHIDCPACGAAGGMRITLDKNSEPFGFCEANCDQQLRIGGSKRRVAAFVARFPWAAGPVSGTGTEAAKPEPEAKPAPVPVPVPEKPAPKPAAKPAPVPEKAPKKPGFDFRL